MRNSVSRARPGGVLGSPDAWLHLLCWVAATAALAMVAWIFGDVVARGLGTLSWSFLTDAARRGGRAGGIAPVLLSTAAVMGVCMLVVLLVGLAGALGLSEFSGRGSRRARLTRLGLDVLAGTPSVAFGLFGYAFFCGGLGLRPSLLVGGLTLACMVLPTFVRVAEQALRSVPESMRCAAAALALSPWRVVASVLLPAAAPGITAAAGISLARALAETAALLFTCGYVLRSPGSLLDPGRVLSLHIYELSMNVPGGDAMAYGAALVLVLSLIALGALTTWGTSRGGRTWWIP